MPVVEHEAVCAGIDGTDNALAADTLEFSKWEADDWSAPPELTMRLALPVLEPQPDGPWLAFEDAWIGYI